MQTIVYLFAFPPNTERRHDEKVVSVYADSDRSTFIGSMCRRAPRQAKKDAAAEGEMTFVGTPRNETLILDNLGGSLERPEFFNIYAPGGDAGRGFHELCMDNLWEIDTTTGEQYRRLGCRSAHAA